MTELQAEDMKRNDRLKFRELFKTEKEMLDEMIKIQELAAVHREDHISWANHLKLLDVRKLSPQHLKDSTLPNSPPLLLRLAAKNENPGARDYVAVSYCWSQKPDGPHTPRFVIETESGKHENKAPANVLMRAVNYALKYKLSFVWIDQECIDQNDSDDKSIGIQSMDLVYAQSRFPVGILGMEVFPGSVVNTFSQLRQWQNSDYREFVSLCQKHLTQSEMMVAGEFLDDLHEDIWFHRAWIHQESACAQDSMMLLLQWESARGLHSKGNTDLEDFEMPFKHISRWARSLRTATNDELYAEPSAIASLGLTTADSITNRSLQILWQAGEQLTASNVVPQLERKGNSVVSDRLAIIANSCYYKLRLDISAVLKAGFHLSSCALTMAILNGDVNPWPESQGCDYQQATWVGPHANRPVIKKPTLEMILPEFLVMWNRFYGCRSDVYADNPRLPSVRLTIDGFCTRGWLWSIDRFSRIGIGPKRCSRILTLLSEDSSSGELKDELNELCLHVYNALEDAGLPGVASSFWKTLHDKAPIPHPQLRFNPGAQCQSNPEKSLPTDVFGNCYGFDGVAGSTQKVTGFSIVDRWREAPWFIRFVKYLLKEQYLPLARLFGPNRPYDLPYYAAVFPVKSFEVGTFIFTSTDKDLEKINGPLGLTNFYCIEVAIPNFQEPELVYRGSWSRGFWSAPIDEMKEYYFPWNVERCTQAESSCRPEPINVNEIVKKSLGQRVLFGAGI